MSAAPPIPRAIRVLENAEAVAAATMPRGAIHPMKARSPFDRLLRSVDTHATRGLVTSTSTATSPRVGSSTLLTELGVTLAEMEMKSTPMRSWITVSPNGRRAGVVTGDVAARRHADHGGDGRQRAQAPSHIQLAQHQPQQRRSDDASGEADTDAEQELAELVAAGDDGAEDERAEDAADRVNERALPQERPLHALGRPD